MMEAGVRNGAIKARLGQLFVLLVLTLPRAAFGSQLLRWEGSFEGDLDLSASPGLTRLTGQWALEMDERELRPTYPGSPVRIASGRPTAFEISPSGWGSTVFTPDNVWVSLQMYNDTTVPHFSQVGWDGLSVKSWTDDFNVVYRDDQALRISYSEADVPSIPKASRVSGTLQPVKLDPYMMGQFTGQFPGEYGFGEFSGRWAIDLEHLLLDPYANTYKPLRYLKITGQYPGSDSFSPETTQAWVLTNEQGQVRRLLIGFGLPNGMRSWEDDFWVDYDFGDGLDLESLPDLTIAPEIRVSSATGFGPTVLLEGASGSVIVVPEPSSLLLLGLGALFASRRRPKGWTLWPRQAAARD